MRARMLLPSVTVALACAGEPPDAARSGGEVRVAIDASLPLGAAEGPLLAPTELRVVATPPDGRQPVSVVLPVATRAARGELVLDRRATAERWRLRGAAAVHGDTVFRVLEDLEAREDAPRPSVALRFVYAGRDAAIASLALSPRDTTLSLGGSVTINARATDALGPILPPPLGWRSRTTGVATVDASGRVTAQATGTSWIVGRSWTGLADSVRVTVR